MSNLMSLLSIAAPAPGVEQIDWCCKNPQSNSSESLDGLDNSLYSSLLVHSILQST